MKRLASVLALIVALMYLAVPALAHSGRTDANGGHYNRATGEYHYHHGYPEHQHPGGECPYDYHDATDYNDRGSNDAVSDDLPSYLDDDVWDTPSPSPSPTPTPSPSPTPSPTSTPTPSPSLYPIPAQTQSSVLGPFFIEGSTPRPYTKVSSTRSDDSVLNVFAVLGWIVLILGVIRALWKFLAS